MMMKIILRSHMLAKGLSLIMLASFLGLDWSGGRADDTPRSPVTVKIQDDKALIVDTGSSMGPVDPVQRIRFGPQQQLNIMINGEQGQNGRAGDK